MDRFKRRFKRLPAADKLREPVFGELIRKLMRSVRELLERSEFAFSLCKIDGPISRADKKKFAAPFIIALRKLVNEFVGDDAKDLLNDVFGIRSIAEVFESGPKHFLTAASVKLREEGAFVFGFDG